LNFNFSTGGMKSIFRILLIGSCIESVCAQSFNNDSRSFKDLLQVIEIQHGVKIFYRSEWINDKKAKSPVGISTLSKQLEQILIDTDLTYSIYDENYVIILKDVKIPATDLQNSTINPSKLHYTLSGKVLTEANEETIINATISIDELQQSTVSNKDGFYSINLPTGEYQVVVSYIGFHTQRFKINIASDQVRDIFLYDKVIELKEIIVGAEKPDHNISDINMGKSKLDIASIKKIPALMGEVDILKSILSLPGVQTAGEGSSGFNVRGGSIDQNLILLDGAPIFNPSHVFGFFSIFNPDAVKDVTLYRGGIPAQYGGRLSSILDIQLKEGNPLKHSIRGGLGLFASRLGVEGPLKKGVATFSLSGRASYSDWALNLYDNRELSNSSASFYDGSLKVSYLIGNKDRIIASGYSSSDQFKFLSDTLYDWQSQVASLNWNHSFSTRFTSNFSAIYSDYQYAIRGRSRGNEFDWQAGINYKALKINLNYTFNEQNNLDFGAQSEWYRFKPGSLFPIGTSSINSLDLERDFSRNYSTYFNHEFLITHSFSIMYGLRYSIFQNLGPGTSFDFEENLPRSLDNLTDSTIYSDGEVIKSYSALEPRLSARFALKSSDAIKFSYNRMRQNIHLISNSTASTPVDIWQTSNNNIKPQNGDLFSLGYFKNFANNTIETSAELYY